LHRLRVVDEDFERRKLDRVSDDRCRDVAAAAGGGAADVNTRCPRNDDRTQSGDGAERAIMFGRLPSLIRPPFQGEKRQLCAGRCVIVKTAAHQSVLRRLLVGVYRL